MDKNSVSISCNFKIFIHGIGTEFFYLCLFLYFFST